MKLRGKFSRIFTQRRTASDWLLAAIKRLPRFWRLRALKIIIFCRRHRLLVRAGALAMVAILAFGWAYEIFGTKSQADLYNLSLAEQKGLVRSALKNYDQYLVRDQKTGALNFNQNYSIGAQVAGDTSVPKFRASFADSPKGQVTVTDPTNETSISITPKFGVGTPQKDNNRVIYPIAGRQAAKVYSLFASGVKEDIVLYQKTSDVLKFTYELQLPEGLEARLESDGSLGVYGVENSLLGSVTTASDKDAELLQKARQNSPKNNRLFGIPAPVVLDGYKNLSSATARFEFKDGKLLTVEATGLASATYPLSIDPSIYVESAAQLMRGNNESNTDFDVTNELIQKSQTTGARINSWTETTAMSAAFWDQSMAAAGGYVYRAGGRTGITQPEVASTTETLDSTDGTSFVMNMPATRPAGDLYVAILCHDGSTGSNMTGPSGGGWTEYADLQGHAAYYKIGTDQGGGSESASYTWTGPNEAYAGAIIRITGFDSSDVLSGAATTTSNASAVTPTFPAITPDTESALIIRGAGFDADTPSATGWVPSGHTKLGSGTSGGTPCGYAAASLDASPNSGSAAASVSFADTSVSDDYGSSSLSISATPVTATVVSTVEWTQFNSSTGALSSTTDPSGSGSAICSGWCTNSAYNMPGARVGAAMTAYNGFLYVLGGSTDGTAANAQTNVWISRLGANGEPSLWHPTGGTEAYWYQSSNTLPVANSQTAIYAYNNKLYLVGGRDTSGNALSAVRVASIGPTGDIGAWSTTGMQDLTTPTARFGHSVHIYNDVMYIIGGNNSGTFRDTVYYSRLNSNGTMNAWVQTSTFTTARFSMGGVMSGVWGGYVYIAGGCTALTSGYCSTIASDVQLASINADGSLSEWNAILNLSNARIGYTFIAWQGALYRFGGCLNQNTSTGACRSTSNEVEYGVINPDGEASTVSTSVGTSTSPCNSSEPYNCDMPGTGNIGNILMASAILNGYLYVIGGCTNVGCTTMTGNVAYVAIGSDGTLRKPQTCPGGAYQGNMWCVDTTRTISGGIAAPGVAVFNGRIYLVGGQGTAGLKGNVYNTSINNDGSLAAAWTAQTFANIAATSVSYTYAYARANPSSAGTYPGNLFIFGGCNASGGGIGCTSGANEQGVYKCNILPGGNLEEANANDCDTAGQLQIGTVSGASGTGLALHAGTVYANYIYLIGGVAPGLTDLATIRYAKFDDSNNVVAVSGGAWVQSSSTLSVGRRRGTSFGYNGYLYVVGGYDAGSTSVLSDIQYAKVNVSDGSLEAFGVSSVTINQRWGLTVPVSNSYAFVIGGCTVGNSPTCTTATNSIQTFQIYNNDSGTVKSITSASDDTFTTDTDRWGASSAVLNGYLYVGGGCISTTDCTNATNSVQYSAISSTDGSLGTWSAASNALPLDRAWGKLLAVGGYLYYIGGQDDTATNEQSTVYYVGTFSSGDITAAWSTASGALGDVSTAGVQTAPRTKFGAAVWDSRIYIIGGLDGSAAATNSVYYSPKLSSGGNIAADSWTLSGNSPDVARFGAAVAAYANNLYQFGGNDGTNYLNDGQFTSLGYKTGTITQTNAGAATTTVTGSGTTFTSAMVGSTLQYSDGSTATISAYSSATSITVSASKLITSAQSFTVLDGSVGSWTFTTSTPGSISQGEAFAANGYMYIVGGRSAASSCVPNTLIAPISANTTIATGNNPTGVGEWYETNVRYAGGRYGAAVSYNRGKVYITGGGCSAPQAGSYSTGTIGQATNTVTGTGTTWTDNYIGGTITYADASTATIVSVNSATQLTVNVSKTVTAPQSYSIAVARHSYGVLKSQPQMAKYSRMIDTDTNVFPNSWLLNGLDNSIGARWQAIYSSATDASNVVYYDNFDNGTNGNTVSDSTGGLTSFDSCSTTGTFSRVYDNTWYATPLLSAKFAVTSATGTGGCYEGYTDTTVRYERFYLRLNSSFPSANTSIYSLDDTTTGGAGALDLQISTTGGLRVRNNGTLNTTLSLDTGSTGNRVEVSIAGGNATVRVFTGTNINGVTPDSSATFALSGDTQTDYSSVGILASGSSAWNWWFDDYQVSSSDWVGPAFPSWGQATNVGDVYLGDVMPYTPKDTAGNNTSFARYYFFFITIDASQTFGYPEDVTRGPTITDLSLFFTSDPSKRLRHGKTFTGGELQPLDTPCGQTVDADCPNP